MSGMVDECRIRCVLLFKPRELAAESVAGSIVATARAVEVGLGYRFRAEPI